MWIYFSEFIPHENIKPYDPNVRLTDEEVGELNEIDREDLNVAVIMASKFVRNNIIF